MSETAATQERAPPAVRLGLAAQVAVLPAATFVDGTLAEARTELVTLSQVTFTRTTTAVCALFVICPCARVGPHCEAREHSQTA